MSTRASILPAGSVAPVAQLADGEYDLTIISKEEPQEDGRFNIRVSFPDAFVKTFQIVDDIASLVPQLSGQLRGRYGIEEIGFIETPDELDVGAVIRVELVNKGE